ncbi:hypothetical protein ACQPYA_18290 [Micromonospora sp. CA-263727]|uniref:hypothetical protein n=1 Tax=Micromonospora sp. CA-263727 TaxID=3239967 RepID=UPI003D8FD10A
MAGRRFDLGAVALAAALAVLVPTLTGLDAALPGRALAAVAFVVLVPGIPLAYAVRLPNRLATVVLALCLSIATTLLGGALGALSGRWDPFTVVTATAAVGLLATPFAVSGIQSAPPAPDSPRPAPPVMARVGGLAGVAVALGLWWVASRQTDAGAAGATGLVAVVPVTYWAALLVLAVVLAWALLRPALDHVVLAAACLAAVVCCYLLVNVADGAAGPGTTWVHVGFVDFVSRTGDLATGADARFSWPGFLAGTAQLVAVAGVADAAPLALPAPAFFAALVLPALWLIGRVVTGSPRSAWLGVLLYVAFNWYQQDYLSAQAVGFVLYTGVLAVLLWAFSAAEVPPLPGPRWRAWLGAAHRIPGRPRAGPAGRAVPAGTVIGLEAALTVVSAALVVSHQLTPVALVAALVCFVLTGATRLRTLWVGATAMFVGWFSYGATGFWTGHIEDLFGDLGRLGGNVATGVGERIVGDPVYQQMQYSRIGWTGLLCLAGMAGWPLVRRHRGAALFAGLAVAPASLLAVQSYGGEVVIRCALYASPVLAPLAAVAVAGTGRAVTRLLGRLPGTAAPVGRAVRFGAAVVLLAGAFAALTTTRGLNASFERVTAAQVAQARTLLAAAPNGAVVGTVEAVGPLPLARFGEVSAVGMPPPGCRDDVPACLREQVGPDGSAGPGFVYVTGTQEKAGQLRSGLPAGWTDRIVDELLGGGGYRVIVRSTEVTVLERVVPGGPDAEGES